ncbi:MAG TPA: RidA family protein [Polyangiaceae bacterium]
MLVTREVVSRADVRPFRDDGRLLIASKAFPNEDVRPSRDDGRLLVARKVFPNEDERMSAARAHAARRTASPFGYKEPMKEAIRAQNAPAAIGPYSQAVRAGGLLFLSGQIPLDPVTGAIVGDDIAAQTERVLQNVAAVLEGAGASFDDVVKTTIFVVDMADYPKVNEVYGRFFREPYPARSTVQVAALPRAARVEVEVVAVSRAG